jgi:hypothetical protein
MSNDDIGIRRSIAAASGDLGITTREYIATMMMQAILTADHKRVVQIDFGTIGDDAEVAALAATIYADALIDELAHSAVEADEVNRND